jgi:uncharacterized protein YndB with AHSA1/START domain
MITFTNTVEIPRPVQDVFSYLADLDNVPEWNSAITAATKITPGAPRVGTTYRLRREIPHAGTDHLEVAALEPTHRLALRGTLNTYHVRFEYQLSESPSGTSLRNQVELEPEGVARLLPTVAANRIRQAVLANLNELVDRLEADPPRSQGDYAKPDPDR